MVTTKTHTIDAAGKALGRVASEAAKALMGKMRADYTPNKDSGVTVTVNNAGKIYMAEKKRSKKVYRDYSGHPGGLKEESYSSLNARKPGETVRRAVQRMLPNNTMRTSRMKKLIVNA